MLQSILETTMLLAQNGSDPWAEVFFGLDAGERFPLLIIAIGCGTGIIIAIAGMIIGLVGSIHRRNAEAAMKQDLLDRGMTADEIAKVIESSTPEDALGRWMASWNRNK